MPSPTAVPNAVRNWIGLRPEERWWLFTSPPRRRDFRSMPDIGWRKALRYALTENPLAEYTREQRSQAMASRNQSQKQASARSGHDIR